WQLRWPTLKSRRRLLRTKPTVQWPEAKTRGPHRRSTRFRSRGVPPVRRESAAGPVLSMLGEQLTRPLQSAFLRLLCVDILSSASIPFLGRQGDGGAHDGVGDQQEQQQEER